MRPTESRVVVETQGDRTGVYVVTDFIDKSPPEQFGLVKVDVRDNAVMLSRGPHDQFFLTKESIPILVEAIKKAQEIE